MILEEICKQRQIQLETEKKRIIPAEMRHLGESAPQRENFIQALSGAGLSCICEIKKASPSKGLIRADFQPKELAKAYVSAGAECISCLTEEHYFQGSGAYLKQVTEMVNIPVLRKDFIIDEYQIYEAKYLGASAILLIAAVLAYSQMEEYFCLAHELGLSCLMEAHTPEEMETIQRLNPKLIGVNNRNLKTFEVNLQTTAELGKYKQKGQLLVAESGIWTSSDMKTVQENGADAVLIGETLMRSENISETLHALRTGTQ